jgi:hypothetical protein
MVPSYYIPMSYTMSYQNSMYVQLSHSCFTKFFIRINKGNKKNIWPLHADVEVADRWGRQGPLNPEPPMTPAKRPAVEEGAGEQGRPDGIDGPGGGRRTPPFPFPGERRGSSQSLEDDGCTCAARVEDAAGATSPEWRRPHRTASRARDTGKLVRRSRAQRRHAAMAHIGWRLSILHGCGGPGAGANGSEVGERRGRRTRAGEDGAAPAVWRRMGLGIEKGWVAAQEKVWMEEKCPALRALILCFRGRFHLVNWPKTKHRVTIKFISCARPKVTIFYLPSTPSILLS